MEHLEVLAAYPDEYLPVEVESLGSAGGFSGAQFWRVRTATETLCLRRWPKEHPPIDRLEFIQAVLWHVTREGFGLVPLPRETRRHGGYVRHGGFLWELGPWMSGEADFASNPTDEKLVSATAALANFHRAAATFPLPDAPSSRSPGIDERCEQLRRWVSGDLASLEESIKAGLWPEIESAAQRICALVPSVAGDVLAELDRCASDYRVALQPCIRDIWHAHVLFEGDQVTGLVDFGSVRAENVAADVARLLGSMAQDNAQRWRLGLETYCAIRPMSETELRLVGAFDRSMVVMAGLNWIDWIYRQRREFASREAIPGRLDEILSRLEYLARPEPLG